MPLEVSCEAGKELAIAEWLETRGGAVVEEKCSTIHWSNSYTKLDCQDTILIVTFLATDECENSITFTGAVHISRITSTDLVKSKGFRLFPNTPNPFREETIISFLLPASEQGTLSIYDGQGKLIWSRHQVFKSGLNEIFISKSELKNNGILYYKLQTLNFAAVGKMVLLK